MVESDMAYGSYTPPVMVDQYLMGNLQAHREIYDFLWTQFLRHPEVSLHITLYLFEHRDPWMEVSALK